MGVAYHFVHFSSINDAAWIFGLAFVLQAGLFVVAAMRGRLRFDARQDAYGWLGAAMIAYALVVYPSLAMTGEHAYPRSPTFGLPCPTTIFTLGLLVWARARVPAWLLVIPLAWSAIGSSAAFAFGIREDLGLAVAAVLTVAAAILGQPRESHARGSAPFDESDATPQHREGNAAAGDRMGVRALGR